MNKQLCNQYLGLVSILEIEKKQDDCQGWEHCDAGRGEVREEEEVRGGGERKI